jgi:hypothetical protein
MARRRPGGAFASTVHELAHSCFLSLVSGIIPPSNPPTCQVEIEDPGKAYEAVIGSVGNKFEALLSGLSREKIKINLLHIIKRSHPGLLARNVYGLDVASI